MEQTVFFPPEWYPQSAVQLTWPHDLGDWYPIIDEVIPCFVAIAKEIAKRQGLLIVTNNIEETKEQLGTDFDYSRVLFRETLSNDSWARDHGGISVFINGFPVLCDFVFNGWGMKFAADMDNNITTMLYMMDTFQEEVELANMRPFVLEGGSIETDGKGTLLTTENCLLSLNRNDFLDKEQLEVHLKELLGVKRVLWLTKGYLEGDDTDSHVDTLARFCSEDTIAYVQCRDETDEHYEELREMEQELEAFRCMDGSAYNLIPLPMADEVVWEGERLPATYANFLILNGAVLMPTYNSPKDEIAKAALQYAFPDREVIGINCLPLIKQHGSLHCVTMQYPKGFVKIEP
ncbi:agmatine deiminase family protein [Parabacteroides sp. OttesenSCG-928-N08]|nr:agmatine deiminase family protein [Parabacteroides sp. OttesenSCG-928-N08]